MSNKRIDKIWSRAREAVSSNEKMKGLVGEVKGKLEKISVDSAERSSFIYQVQVVIRMIKAHFQGTYRAFSTTTIVTLVFALVYFITPVDLIPDFIPALGLTDDISLVYMIFRTFADDIARFRAWEEEVGRLNL